MMKRPKLRAQLVVFWLTTSAIFVTSVLMLRGTDASSFHDDDSASGYVYSLQSMASLHFVADVAIHFVSGADGEPIEGGLTGNGWFEYWLEGEKYAIDSYVDLVELAGYDVAIAFDGEEHRTLRRDRSLLVTKLGDRDSLGMMLPNPLWYLLQHLYPLDDESWAYPLTIARVRSMTADDIVGNITWVSQSEDGNTLVAEYPGGVLAGHPYVHRITFDRYGERFVPVEIVRMGEEGPFTVSEFSGFVAAEDSGVAIPSHVAVRSYDENGNLWVELNYDIHTIQFDTDIDDSWFTIPDALAERVFDQDIGEFVQ